MEVSKSTAIRSFSWNVLSFKLMAHYKNFTNPGSSKRIKLSVEFEFQMQETDLKKTWKGWSSFKKNTDQLRRNNLLCANHLELSQFMNPKLKNKLIYCAVPTLFDVPNKPNKIKLSRQPPKKKVYTSSINISICKNSSNRLWWAINAIKENTHNKSVSTVTKEAVSQRPC